MPIIENIRMAFRSIIANKLRTILTMLIVAVGIASLVGILTSIDVIIFTMSDNFSSLGANSFSVVPSGQSLGGKRHGRQEKKGDPISFDQAYEFKQRMSQKAIVTLGMNASSRATVKYQNKKTDPNVVVLGKDKDYLEVSGREILVGRNFTSTEIDNAQHKCLLGMAIIDRLFDGDENKALGKLISISSVKYKVIGVLEEQGSSLSQSGDRWVMIPVENAKGFYGSHKTNFDITVAIVDPIFMDQISDESIGVFRSIRQLRIGQENNFEIKKSEGIVEFLKENTAIIRLAAVVIGLMTIISAAVGLMNIMLVTVTERTKEIGISKALGATRKTILLQFLIEALIICLLGGLLGVILGILFGNIVTVLFGGVFLVPWNWVVGGLTTCIFVGLVAGLYPALKASALDPIESLRYE